MKTEDFHFDHFSWEHNINFVHYAGSHSLPIRYDLPDEDLYPLLNQINGVYFTGGGIIDLLGSPYYKTARKIFDYSIEQMDKHNITWPVFGICQGFETLHLLANNASTDTLTYVEIYSESRPYDWQVNPKADSRVFSEFP